MKSVFAVSLIAASALAQDTYYYDSYNTAEVEQDWKDKLPIEINEAGNYELVLPEVPSIEFA